MTRIDRRRLLQTAALAPAAALAAELAPIRAAEAQNSAEGLPEPKYTLSVNLEIMFPSSMPYAERIGIVADSGCKAFSFWGLKQAQAQAMEAAQQKHGLKCGSITGNGKTGWNTGLTKTGYEEAFLQDFKDHIEVAKRFGVK